MPQYCQIDHPYDQIPLAVALAPQVSDVRSLPMGLHYVPVCADHLDGWWDGADFTEKEIPAMPLTTR